eukprot:scaffold25608_cov308-Cylindrotheca_fusiformis.AAC.1
MCSTCHQQSMTEFYLNKWFVPTFSDRMKCIDLLDVKEVVKRRIVKLGSDLLCEAKFYEYLSGLRCELRVSAISVLCPACEKGITDQLLPTTAEYYTFERDEPLQVLEEAAHDKWRTSVCQCSWKHGY